VFEVGKLRLIKEKKAISTFVLVLLILCAATVGSLVSYWWVMGNFYLEPENTVALTITNATFPVYHADYFTFTILNPSNSISSTNITAIYLTAGGSNVTYNVTTTYPDTLPIKMDKATSKTIKCFKNWGELAGQNITIHVLPLEGSGATKTVETKYVKMDLEVFFDANASCTQFSTAVVNEVGSAINLTLTKVLINEFSLTGENLSKTLPQNVTNNDVPVSFVCKYNWENLVDKIVRVETAEGYYAETTSNVNASALLSIDDVKFSETNSTEFSVTVSNSNVSKNAVNINKIALTYGNDTKQYINGSLTTPTFNSTYRLEVNTTVTFNHCIWNWTNHRDENVTITVYTEQNFTAVSRKVISPQSIVFKISPIFSLNSTTYFLVNVTNTPVSLNNIIVTQIKINNTQASITSQTVLIGEWRQFTCFLNWADLRGEEVFVYVNASNVIVSQILTLPHVQFDIVGHGNASDKTKFNVTIVSSSNSFNATLDKIIVILGNKTVFQCENLDFLIQPDGNITLSFPWNWSSIDLTQVTISVYTTENLVFNGTITVT
jgi:hypothetical protein